MTDGHSWRTKLV